MIHWNYLDPDPIFMDIETQSAISLPKFGAKVYCRDVTTRLSSCVFKRGERVIVWIPPGRAPSLLGLSCETWYGDGPPPAVLEWLAEGKTLVAHNAESFDSEAWRALVRVESTWCDSIHFVRHAGLPAGLDGASKACGGPGKSDDSAMKLLMTAKVRNGEVVYPVGTTKLWESLIAYNIADVLELERVWNYATAIPIPPWERRMMQLNAEINGRGMRVDLQFARRLRTCWEESKEESVNRISEMTGGVLNADNIGSVKQVKQFVASLGFETQSLDKRVVDQILENPQRWLEDIETTPAQLIVAVLAERQNAIRATVGKLDRLFAVADPDGVVRGSLVYYGAQATGRFSGRDLQPHNFPRGVSFDESGDALAACLRPEFNLDYAKRISTGLEEKATSKADKRAASVASVLSTMTRNVIQAREGCELIPADFASIEARGVAWIARCDSMLSIFANPKADVYCDMASKLYGRTITKKDKQERHVGKQIVLGCGYQMGAEKFGANCQVYLVDLDAAGVTAEQCVQAYRTGYPEIKALWRDLQNAALYVVRTGRSMQAGRCHFFMNGSWLFIQLPSGRCLKYRNARVEKHPPKWDLSGKPIDGVWFDTPYGFPRSLYGGLIAENIVQALSRDLLVFSMLDLSQRWPIILHVHDEIVPEVPYARRELALHDTCRTMSTAPKWAGDFPIGVEAFTTPVYSKYPLPTSIHAKFLNGVQV